MQNTFGSRKWFAFLNASYTKTSLIKSLISLDFSRPYRKLLENQKARGLKELFLPENDFQNISTENFPKKHPNFGGLETSWRYETQT